MAVDAEVKEIKLGELILLVSFWRNVPMGQWSYIFKLA
jgi:hypothetical protein